MKINFNWFKKAIPNYILVENESRYYSEHIFQSDEYLHHSFFGDYFQKDYKDKKEYITERDMTAKFLGEYFGQEVILYKLDKCHIFSMGTQKKMIQDEWLKKTGSPGPHRGEYRDDSALEDWLEENMIGFYATRGWGNGRHNYGQIAHGLWHVEVYIMREDDAMLFKMSWL